MEVSEKVLIDRDLLAKATMLPSMRSLEENRRDIVERGRAQADIREMLAAAPAAPVVQAEPVAFAITEKQVMTAYFSASRLHISGTSNWVAAFAQSLNKQIAAPPAHPDAALVEALRNMLSDDDIRHLRRFQEICEDSDADGHDLPKEAVRRLERAGALRSCGFGRHETTLFGDAILAALAGKGGAQ